MAIETLPQGITVAQVLKDSQRILAAAGIDTAAQEVRWLLESALHTTRTRIHTDGGRRLTPLESAEMQRLIARRAAREPLQYILGTQEFCGLEISVSPEVLIPRPETELVVEEALRCVDPHRPSTIVDVGTGSGCIAVAVASALPQASIYAIDASVSALAVARRNLDRHHPDRDVTCLAGDLCQPLKAVGRASSVDAILSNPPYVSEGDWQVLQPEVRDHEPRAALVAGVTGTEVHDRLLDQAWRFLVPGGWLIMEVGMGQADVVCRSALASRRYAEPTVRKDAAGIDRIVCVRSRGN